MDTVNEGIQIVSYCVWERGNPGVVFDSQQ